jgi:hypothetical protein
MQRALTVCHMSLQRCEHKWTVRVGCAARNQACQQRSSVRAALIGTQTELAEAAAELDAWTHELAAFQDIVDAVMTLSRIQNPYCSPQEFSACTEQAGRLPGHRRRGDCAVFPRFIPSCSVGGVLSMRAAAAPTCQSTACMCTPGAAQYWPAAPEGNLGYLKQVF